MKHETPHHPPCSRRAPQPAFRASMLGTARWAAQHFPPLVYLCSRHRVQGPDLAQLPWTCNIGSLSEAITGELATPGCCQVWAQDSSVPQVCCAGCRQSHHWVLFFRQTCFGLSHKKSQATRSQLLLGLLATCSTRSLDRRSLQLVQTKGLSDRRPKTVRLNDPCL